MATSTQLPEVVREEIEDLPRHFQIRHQVLRDRVMLTARVRGVPVVLTLDAGGYPFTPPQLELASGWSWPAAQRGRIDCLESQARWNRTLGIAALLRELRQRFRDQPPVQDLQPPRRSLWRFVANWLARLRERFRRRPPTPELASAAAGPEALREIYDRMIRDHTSRVHRYQQAVAELASQWRHKADRLEARRAEIRDLEERQGKALAAAGRIVDELRAAGRSTAAIRADREYRRIRSDYEQCSAELSEVEERTDKLDADAEKHLAEIERHEAQLEKLMGELEDLKGEASEVVTDMTLVQLEKEIVDVRAGITHAAFTEELRDIRQRLRRERAKVRVTREATAEGDGDELYLEVADRVEAARELERTLGLEDRPAAREPEA